VQQIVPLYIYFFQKVSIMVDKKGRSKGARKRLGSPRKNYDVINLSLENIDISGYEDI